MYSQPMLRITSSTIWRGCSIPLAVFILSGISTPISASQIVGTVEGRVNGVSQEGVGVLPAGIDEGDLFVASIYYESDSTPNLLREFPDFTQQAHYGSEIGLRMEFQIDTGTHGVHVWAGESSNKGVYILNDATGFFMRQDSLRFRLDSTDSASFDVFPSALTENSISLGMEEFTFREINEDPRPTLLSSVALPRTVSEFDLAAAETAGAGISARRGDSWYRVGATLDLETLTLTTVPEPTTFRIRLVAALGLLILCRNRKIRYVKP